MKNRISMLGLSVSAMAAGAALAPMAANAEMVRFEVTSVEPAFGGEAFGEIGAYEKVTGIAHFAVDPNDPANTRIADITLAPRNADGDVEFDSDVVILRPADAQRNNGRLIYEPVNRGNPLSINMMNSVNSRDADDAGNGFLMEQGYTIVLGGWQVSYPMPAPVIYLALGSKLPPEPGLLTARLPVAVNADGSPIVQPDREQFFDLGPREKLTGFLTYPAADVTAPTELVMGEAEDDPWQPVPEGTWRYLDEWRVEIDRAAIGASPAALWELRYTARDPQVYGLGLAVMRDTVSWLRHNAAASDVIAPGAAQYVLGFGASQTGRTVKELVSEFPSDEAGRRLFDGVAITISGAGRNAVNTRFSRPGLKVGHHGTRELPGDDFPFTYGQSADILQGGKVAGLLDICRAEGNCPKMFHIDSENEMWHGGALTFVDTAGQDLPPPDDVRYYVIAATEHSPSGGGGVPPMCRVRQSNGIDWRPMQRAFMLALDNWATRGTEPPQSRYPTVASGTLVAPEDAVWPSVPGMRFTGAVSKRYVVDFSTMPPGRGAGYPTLVPSFDADGQMAGGLQHPWVSRPIATHTGWNPRLPGAGGDDLCMIYGMTLPFAVDKQARMQTGDPRLSIGERYGSADEYAALLRRDAEALAQGGYLLESDIEPVVAEGRSRFEKATATAE